MLDLCKVVSCIICALQAMQQAVPRLRWMAKGGRCVSCHGRQGDVCVNGSNEFCFLQILEGIVPELLRKKEEEEKRQRVAQRMQRQLNSIITDENGGYGRCAEAFLHHSHQTLQRITSTYLESAGSGLPDEGRCRLAATCMPCHNSAAPGPSQPAEFHERQCKQACGRAGCGGNGSRLTTPATPMTT